MYLSHQVLPSLLSQRGRLLQTKWRCAGRPAREAPVPVLPLLCEMVTGCHRPSPNGSHHSAHPRIAHQPRLPSENKRWEKSGHCIWDWRLGFAFYLAECVLLVESSRHCPCSSSLHLCSLFPGRQAHDRSTTFKNHKFSHRTSFHHLFCQGSCKSTLQSVASFTTCLAL